MQNIEKLLVWTPVIPGQLLSILPGKWDGEKLVIGFFAAITAEVQDRFKYDSSIADIDLYSRYSQVAAEDDFIEILTQGNIMLDCVRPFIEELLRINITLLRTMYLLKDKQSITKELCSYYYMQDVEHKEAGMFAMPLYLYADTFCKWIQIKDSGNFLFNSLALWPLTYQLTGRSFMRTWCPKKDSRIFRHINSDIEIYDDCYPLKEFDFEHQNFQFFDGGILIPFFGARVKDVCHLDHKPEGIAPSCPTEIATLQMAARQIKGRSVVFVPQRFLNSDIKQIAEIRLELCQTHKITAVCQFPVGFMGGQSFRLSAIFLDTKPQTLTDGISFIDFSEFDLQRNKNKIETNQHIADLLNQALSGIDTKYSAKISNAEVESNSFQLLPSAYVGKEKSRLHSVLNTFETVELGRIADIVRCQVLPTVDGQVVGEVQVSSIDRFGFIDEDLVSKEVKYAADNAIFQRQTLHEQELVMAVKGVGAGKVGIAWGIKNKLVASQYFVIIRLKDDAPLNVFELYYALRSDLVREYILANAQSTTMPMLKASTVSKLPILLPGHLIKNAEAKFRLIADLRTKLKHLEKKMLKDSLLVVMK